MTCDQIQPLLADYAAGAATADERALVERHLTEGCDGCREELTELQEAAALLLDAAPLPPPPHLRARLLEAIDVDQATASTRPQAKPRRPMIALAIAATLAAIALGAALLRTSAVPEAIDDVIDNWRGRIAESERELGVRGARLVSLPIDAFQNSVVTHVLYDSLAEQLHVWASHNPIAKQSEPNWAWLIDDRGAVVARGELKHVSLGRLAAVLDVRDLRTETAKVLLTVEPQQPDKAPGDEVVEQGVLQIR